jgi:hypothetical protein
MRRGELREVLVAVRLTRGEYERLAKLADLAERSRSDILRMLLARAEAISPEVRLMEGVGHGRVAGG